MAVRAKSYTSPTLVLLAFDWELGGGRNDFLGFAIKRVPGFGEALLSRRRAGFPIASIFPGRRRTEATSHRSARRSRSSSGGTLASTQRTGARV